MSAAITRADSPERATIADLASAVGVARQWVGVGVAAVLLVVATTVLVALHHRVSLADDVLVYLLAVLAAAVIGGLWPAVTAAIAASLALNYWLTPPTHTLTIDEPANVLALVLFVVVATVVAAVVHLSARRAVLASRNAAQARQLLEQASQAQALEAGNRMRTALLAAVSHDLRTPLASIKAGVSSLRQDDVDYSPDDSAELLATIEDGADRLDALIANLLDMSRLQTGALTVFAAPTDVEEVTLLAMRGLAGEAAVQLDLPEDLPLLHLDAGLLERALANLIANALRYSPPNRPPSVAVSRSQDRLVIDVIDHGPGVAAPSRETMFEPFQRLGDQDTTTGIGLGLAVSRGFVEALGGKVRARPTPGGGLTMTVELPVPDDAPGTP